MRRMHNLFIYVMLTFLFFFWNDFDNFNVNLLYSFWHQVHFRLTAITNISRRHTRKTKVPLTMIIFYTRSLKKQLSTIQNTLYRCWCRPCFCCFRWAKSSISDSLSHTLLIFYLYSARRLSMDVFFGIDSLASDTELSYLWLQLHVYCLCDYIVRVYLALNRMSIFAALIKKCRFRNYELCLIYLNDKAPAII